METALFGFRKKATPKAPLKPSQSQERLARAEAALDAANEALGARVASMCATSGITPRLAVPARPNGGQAAPATHHVYVDGRWVPDRVAEP
jgi:hypothetical protein